jgi:hypothetical protein
MRKDFYLTVLLAIVTIGVYGLQLSSDSAEIVKTKQKTTPTITTRVHTMGLFMYMGKVVNHNPAADIFFTYSTRSGWGVSAFKVVDLNDIHSHNNFAFVFVHKSFHLGKRITVSPYAGVALEQQHSFASHGSDIMLQLNSSFRINKNFTVEHIAMFNNVAIETHYADWTNRVRVLYSNGHVDLSGFFWHNNGLIDNGNYTSSGISAFYNRVPISKRLFLGAGLTTLSTVQSSNPEKIPTQTGFQFTTILTFK